ncbi:MAG TPA: PLP-dependent aminotransferase family protein [Planctomycetaceae bacterium]|jgi:2-aminoadipate transaminase|nr:PLP-dependent aminotransferase family protein [Planctomycetaceae bacterium]
MLHKTTEPSPPAAEVKLSRRWQWSTRGRAISYLMEQAVENPNAISLAAGLVDPSTLPVAETRRVLADLLGDTERGCRALQYGTTQGAERLRRQVALLLGRLETQSAVRQNGAHAASVEIDPAQIILTTGSQQLLSLVGEILLDPDDICLVAAPTYFVFLGVIHGLGARAVPIPADENGMQIDRLEQELERIDAAGELSKVKLIYAVSYYENPSGISLSTERRRELVALAERWSRDQKIFVLEDAAYRELHYDGPDRPSVWSFDPAHETVILAQTFSKSFSPGLRVGYGLLPKPLVGPVADRKGNEDFGSSNFNQHLLATVLESGLYEPHVEQVRASYRVKRDRILAAADKYFADLPGVSWVHPQGGLYVWMTLPEQIDTGLDSALFKRAVKIDGMMYVPGDLCYAGTPAQRRRNQMRLSFGVESPDKIEEGIRRLASAVRAVL